MGSEDPPGKAPQSPSSRLPKCQKSLWLKAAVSAV